MMEAHRSSRWLGRSRPATGWRGTAVAAAVALWVVVPMPASAIDDQEVRLLLDRVSRLESQLGTLQSRVETGGTRSAAPSPSLPAGPLPPTAAARLELRVTDLESQLANMNGRIEELDYSIRQMQTRIETALSDIEYRLSGGSGTAAPPPTASASPPPPPPAAVAPDPTLSGVTLQSGVPRSQPPATQAPTPLTPSGAAPAQSAAALATLPPGTEEEQYRYATTFLRQAAYEDAESALRAFIVAHPDGALIGNARYWLGETYYVRERYEDAIVAFAEGYQKAPQGPKAADNLLKLGMSLAKLNKRQEACATFSQLRSQFPDTSNFIKQTAASERRRLGC